MGCAVLGYLFCNYALTNLNGLQVTTWIHLEPPIAVVLGALLLGEVIGWPIAVGVAAILASVWLISRIR